MLVVLVMMRVSVFVVIVLVPLVLMVVLIVVVFVFFVLMIVFVMVAVLMVGVVVLVFLMVMVMMRLHALDGFLALRAVADDVHQADRDHVFIDGRLAGVLHPRVGLAAHINQHVAGGKLHDVLRRGLVAVHVHAVPQEQRQLAVLRLSPYDLLRPIIERINRRNDFQLLRLVRLVLCLRRFRGLGTAAA